MSTLPPREPPSAPPFRALRGYAFDPSLSTQLETAVLNEVVFRVKWEKDLKPGPVGEYLEVVDVDPASGCYYAPVDLNHPHLLGQAGLAPSEGNPQFHQQMVYAVAMTTIRNFERALGRRALWAPHDTRGEAPPADGAKREVFEYVPRLRIYPHALRQENAFYSMQKKSLLFGYFPARANDPGDHYPGGMVFTCLSHDVVAHETTHALLDGMHRRFVEANHPDALAFHEAFADIVALFQHFTFPEVLRHQIAKTRGDLASQNLLGELAQQFGRAKGGHGALRDAIGRVNPATRRWEAAEPDPADYANVMEAHDRGAILVAAVFDAFISIYKTRVEDLFRLATGGTGVPAPGALHPDLVNRLADEAAKSAQHVLNMCIRALDYCPPVDITFGDYLRALITADYDLVRSDDRGYRVAFIEAFRRRGIYPRDVRTLSEDTLRWKSSHEDVECDLGPICKVLRQFVAENAYLAVPGIRPGWLDDEQGVKWDGLDERERIWRTMEQYGARLNNAINDDTDRAAFARLTGLELREKGAAPAPGDPPVPRGLRYRDREGAPRYPKIEVHSLRPAQRVGPDGDLLTEVVISLTQKRKCLVYPEQEEHLGPEWYDDDDLRAQNVPGPEGMPVDGFWFRGGCTLILNLETQQLRYAVIKRVGSESRLARQQEYRSTGQVASLRATYFGPAKLENEPFAFLHASHEAEP
jgi:hypothetical protein